jgi:aldehyde dehydrogenase
MEFSAAAGLTADILPPGVLNVVTGPGGTVGQAIAASPLISKVSFTGETTTGKQIMRYAAEHLIPQTMELGGRRVSIENAPHPEAAHRV